MDIDIAERLIEYKIKMSEQWLESKPIKKVESNSESDNEDELPTLGKNKTKKWSNL